MTKFKLRYKYGSYVHKSWKHMGAGKETKEYFKWKWDNFAGYLNELRDLSPRDYALTLLEIERKDFTDDRWWDVPDYRKEAIKNYRERVKSIRLKYGLSKSDVACFMRVA